AVILRSEIIFADAVALARLHQLARAVDTQAVDHIARPTSTIAGARQPLFCREHTVAGIGGDMTLENGLVAEGTKTGLDLPFDAQIVVARLGQACARPVQRGAKSQDKDTHNRATGIEIDLACGLRQK